MATKRNVTFKVGRGAEDGRFKTVDAARQDRKGSIVETITRPIKPPKKSK